MEAEAYSISTLAWLGDAIYELAMRRKLIAGSSAASGRLHNAAVDYVAARAQAKALLELLPELDDDEQNLVKRARNFHTPSLPKHQSLDDYRLATALEALVGWLELKGRPERMRYICDRCWDILSAAETKES